MKDDLREKLTEKYVETGNKKYKEQLALVQDAEISTIHSFCSKLLRRYFYLTELDCKFEVAEEMIKYFIFPFIALVLYLL